MNYYLAPMEGVTTYIFRQAYDKYFYKMDKYFTPFLVPHINKGLNSREENEILPEHNSGMYLVPQILTNNSGDFVRLAETLRQYGHEEINLNLGCPSKTVAAKGRGSGFLEEPDKLDRFLYEVFESLDMKISAKTRLGTDSPEEFEDLLAIYNKYPLEELIIHPRVQKDYYNNSPDWGTFDMAVKNSKNPLCYNGNLFSPEDLNKFRKAFPSVPAAMLGRGVIRNPFLLNEAQGEPAVGDCLKGFHEEIYRAYRQICSGDRNILFRMKELWSYMTELFPEDKRKKIWKKIKKTEKTDVYERVIQEVFAEIPANRTP